MAGRRWLDAWRMVLEDGFFVKGSWGFTVRAWVWLFGLGLGTAFWGLKAVVAVLQQHTGHRPLPFGLEILSQTNVVAVLQQQTGRWGMGLIDAIALIGVIEAIEAKGCQRY